MTLIFRVWIFVGPYSYSWVTLVETKSTKLPIILGKVGSIVKILLTRYGNLTCLHRFSWLTIKITNGSKSIIIHSCLHWRPKCLGWQAILPSKTASGEVGVWLTWWCPALVLPAPGSWGHFLNLIIFSYWKNDQFQKL